MTIKDSLDNLEEEVKQDRIIMVDIGKISKRQLELGIDAVHDYAHKQLKWAIEVEARSDEVHSMYRQNYEDLTALEKYLWTLTNVYKEQQKYKEQKEKEFNCKQHIWNMLDDRCIFCGKLHG